MTFINGHVIGLQYAKPQLYEQSYYNKSEKQQQENSLSMSVKCSLNVN